MSMKKKRPPRSIWTNPIHFIACGFGAGASRYAPGTFGTLVAIPFYLFLRHLPAPLYLTLTFIAFILGIWLCDITAKAFGLHDHPAIVWDEIVGYWLTMWLAPTQHNWLWIFVGFVLFRLFDIWKPWPIRWVDKKIHGGTGIMLDDIVAAIAAWLCLHLLCVLIPL